MPKLTLTILLLIAGFCVNAQTVVCKDTTYHLSTTQSGYDINRYMVYEIVGSRDSIIYKTQCGKPCQIGIHKPHKVTDKIIQIPVYDSVAHYDTVRYTITVTYDSIGRKCDTIPLKVVFGAKLQGSVDNQITALKKMGVKGVRTSVILKDFTGIEKSLDTYINEGFIPAVNLRWTNVVPSPFCTDTNAYKVKEKLFLDKYAAKIIAAGGFILCENEPMNLGYYGTAPIEDYITLLRLFVRVAQPYNINTSDGCLFVEYLNLEATKGYLITDRFGNTDTISRLKDKIITQRKLLTAYKTIPLTFLNVHLGIHDDVLETGMIKNSLDYLRVQTGKNDIVTNEYHYETCTGSSDITKKTISEWKKAGVLFCYVWSGDQLEGQPATGGNSPAMALSLDINLTELGVSQANAIK